MDLEVINSLDCTTYSPNYNEETGSNLVQPLLESTEVSEKKNAQIKIELPYDKAIYLDSYLKDFNIPHQGLL